MKKICTLTLLALFSVNSMAAEWALDARINLKKVKTAKSLAKTVSLLTREVIEDGADDEGGSYFCSTSSRILESYVSGNTYHLILGFSSYGNLCSADGKDEAVLAKYYLSDVRMVKLGEVYDRDQQEGRKQKQVTKVK